MLLRSESEAKAFVADRCSLASFERLGVFVARLEQESATQNLVAASTIPNLWVRHIADSAQLLDHVSHETQPWLDLGSGAGFPGLVAAIMQPQREFVLVESRSKRIRWLEDMIDELAITNCRVLGSEVQTIRSFDASVISARAFAPLGRLIELSARFSTTRTEWVLPRGRSAAQDVAMLGQPIASMFHVEPSVTDADAGILVGRGDMWRGDQ